MFPKDKIIEIFSMCDDFSKVFDSIVSKSAIAGAEPERKREYHRDGKMSDYEVMTILILFHNSGYLMAGIAAYRFFPKKPMLQLDREINNQLTIF
jgi:hypothetical protein